MFQSDYPVQPTAAARAVVRLAGQARGVPLSSRGIPGNPG
jgi:hypothetical protein